MLPNQPSQAPSHFLPSYTTTCGACHRFLLTADPVSPAPVGRECSRNHARGQCCQSPSEACLGLHIPCEKLNIYWGCAYHQFWV